MSWADYTAFLKKDGTVEHGALFNKDDASALAADGITVSLLPCHSSHNHMFF